MLALKDAFFTHHQQCFCRVTVWGLPWVESLPERGGRPSRPCRGKSGVRRRHAGRTTCLRAAQGHSAEPQALREGPGPRRSCWRGLKAAGSGARRRGDVSASFWAGRVRLPGKQSRNRREEGSGWSVQPGWSSASTLSSPQPSSQAALLAWSRVLGAEVANVPGSKARTLVWRRFKT